MDKPWLTEPDVETWIDPKTGYKCEILRIQPQEMGHLCGYVSVPEGHPLFGNDYEDPHIDVHGGLTYSTQSGETWKFGFDCAHAGDVTPFLNEKLLTQRGDVYRDWNYVKKEVESLAEQLWKSGNK